MFQINYNMHLNSLLAFTGYIKVRQVSKVCWRGSEVRPDTGVPFRWWKVERRSEVFHIKWSCGSARRLPPASAALPPARRVRCLMRETLPCAHSSGRPLAPGSRSPSSSRWGKKVCFCLYFQSSVLFCAAAANIMWTEVYESNCIWGNVCPDSPQHTHSDRRTRQRRKGCVFLVP